MPTIRFRKLTVFWSNTLIRVLVIFMFSGMARRPMKEVEKKAAERSGIELHDLKRNSNKEQRPSDLSAEKLTLETALKIALTNNSEIQAIFQDLGIANAEVWQATLFKNPTFDGSVRFPNQKNLENGNSAQNNVEFGISQDFIDVILMPFRRRAAAAEYEAVRLRVTDDVLAFILEVKKAYYSAQAGEQVLKMQRTVLEAAEAAGELAERQRKAGTLKALDLSIERAAYEEAKLSADKSKADALLAREPLNRLMGVSGEDAGLWKINDPFQNLPAADPKLEDLETRALSERLDLAAIRQQSKVLKRNLTAARLGIIPQAEAGFNTEKETDGGRITGPTWNVEVPVWDQQLAKGSKVKAQWRQNQFSEAAYEVKVRSEVREAMIHLEKSRTAVESYRDRIIPERENIVSQYLKEYNFMLTGVYQLLDAKQKEVLARREYIENLRDYWSSLAELERAVGGKLEPGEIKQKQKDKKESMAEPVPSDSVMPMDHSQHGGNHE